MKELYFVLAFLPLVMRHAHHFWCTRHAHRRIMDRGMVSVVFWFIAYVGLMIGMFFELYNNTQQWYFIAGCCVLWLAAAGRMHSIHQLGKAFNEFIHIEPQQKLVDTGIYSIVRHPLHYFLMLEMIGMALVIQNLWGWILVALSAVVLVFRELQEEKALENAFGEKYRQYRKRAVALVDILFIKK